MRDTPRRSSRLTEKAAMSGKKGEKAEKEKDKADQSTIKVNFGEEFSSFKKDIATMIAQQETRINTKFKDLENKLSGMFNTFKEEMREDMTQVRREIEESNIKVAALTDKVTDLEKSVDFHSNQVTKNEEKCQKRHTDIQSDLDNKITGIEKKLENKLKLLEKHDRKYNLLFYGFTEDSNENVYTTMRDSFIKELNIEEERVQNMYFANGHRMPSKNPGPKPIILRFTSFEDRELVLSKSYQYGGMRKRVLVDLPEDMKKERNRLAKIAFQIRQSEEKKTRIRDKGLDMILEMKPKNSKPSDKWVQRFV